MAERESVDGRISDLTRPCSRMRLHGLVGNASEVGKVIS